VNWFSNYKLPDYEITIPVIPDDKGC
jgi:hypothetical protein